MDSFKKYLQQHADELDCDEPGAGIWEKISHKTITENHLPETETSSLAPQSQFAEKTVIIRLLRYAAAACLILLVAAAIRYLLENKRTNTQAVSAAVVTGPQRVTPENNGPVSPENDPLPLTGSRSLSLAENNHAVRNSTLSEQATGNAVKDKNFQAESTGLPAERNKQHHEKSSVVFADRSAVSSLSYRNTTLPDPAEELAPIENSFTRIINLQKSKLNSTPLYAESPAYFSDFKKQLNQMGRDEQTLKKDITRLGLTSELLDRLINIYQQKLSVLQQLQREINKTNNTFQRDQDPVTQQKISFLHL